MMMRKEIINHALGAGVTKEIHARYIKRFRIRKWTSIHEKSQNRLILFVYLYFVRINIKTEFCSIWSRNPRIFFYSEVLCKKVILKNFVKFTRKLIAGLRSETLLKMRFWYRCFVLIFCEVYRKTFFIEHPRATTSVTEKISEPFDWLTLNL